MHPLWLYGGLSRLRVLNFRAKIMVVAFLGTHVPLIALIGWSAAREAERWSEVLDTLAVTLVSTLAGSGVTLFVLSHLLRPVLLVARALSRYRCERIVEPLPHRFGDEVGRLMRDAAETIGHLEMTRTRLEEIDATTGLGNRTRFTREIDAAIATGAPVSVATIIFDNYGRISKSVGHAAAEAALIKLAARLGSFLGSDAALARVAPDRFALVAQSEPTETTVERLQDLILAGGQTIEAGGLVLRPQLRAGVALAGRDADGAEALLDCATTAAAGQEVGARVTVFSPATREAARETLRIEEDFATAIERDEFMLHYQPIVDLETGTSVGAEALLRWRHPEAGMIPPGRFIPVAEKSGLIRPVGYWVLNAACAQIAAWNADELPRQRIAINLAAEQFHDAGLVDEVRRAIDAHGISAHQLEIELTETAATTDHTHTRAVFARLRDLGVRISIDDFGTGFASLSQLRRFPFDKLKIDREFVTEVHVRPESQAICGALIALGEGLRIDVLAEGTEQAEEIRWLHDRGCHLFQGFGFARPMPASDYAQCLLSGEFGVRAESYRAARSAA